MACLSGDTHLIPSLWQHVKDPALLKLWCKLTAPFRFQDSIPDLATYMYQGDSDGSFSGPIYMTGDWVTVQQKLTLDCKSTIL